MRPGEYKESLARVFSDACRRLSPLADGAAMETPRNPQLGDYACAAAMPLAAKLRRAPADIAADILQQADLPDFVESAQITGGYINVKIKPAAKAAIVGEVLRQGDDFGRAADCQQTVILEFVSANPTGPLHVGHGRAAAYGDSLANILTLAGYEVRREYYVNDAGRQADILAASAWLRHYLPPQAEIPEGAYRGEYLNIPKAAELLSSLPQPADINSTCKEMSELPAEKAGDLLAKHMREHITDDELRGRFVRAVSDSVLAMIKNDLESLGVTEFDKWFCESELRAKDKIAEAIDEMKRRDSDNVYEKDGALWFRSAALGDDKDRVLRRANGEYTYFAADIAYHHDKLSRKVSKGRRLALLNILGADHHGYVPRLAAAISALGFDKNDLEARLIQFVSLRDGGQRLKMSTRGGTYITVAELVDKIGKDAARLFYVNRKNDQHLEVDITLATEKSAQNPAFYLHYAHARACSVLEKWKEEQGGNIDDLQHVDCEPLAADPAAMTLCALLSAFPDAVATAARERAAHLLTNFMRDLAGAINDYYERTRILTTPPDPDMTARLALLAAAQNTLCRGLALLGVSARTRMEKYDA